MIGFLEELSFREISGGSIAPLSFQEIESWQRQTGLVLSAWEVLALHRLSEQYVNELHAARDTNAPAPYTGAVTREQRDTVGSMLRSLTGRSSKPKES